MKGLIDLRLLAKSLSSDHICKWPRLILVKEKVILYTQLSGPVLIESGMKIENQKQSDSLL